MTLSNQQTKNHMIC